MSKKEIIKRLKDPVVLLALAGLSYKVLGDAGIKMDIGTYRQYVDVVAYVVLGYGIYHFGKSE